MLLEKDDLGQVLELLLGRSFLAGSRNCLGEPRSNISKAHADYFIEDDKQLIFRDHLQ